MIRPSSLKVQWQGGFVTLKMDPCKDIMGGCLSTLHRKATAMQSRNPTGDHTIKTCRSMKYTLPKVQLITSSKAQITTTQQGRKWTRHDKFSPDLSYNNWGDQLKQTQSTTPPERMNLGKARNDKPTSKLCQLKVVRHKNTTI